MFSSSCCEAVLGLWKSIGQILRGRCQPSHLLEIKWQKMTTGVTVFWRWASVVTLLSYFTSCVLFAHEGAWIHGLHQVEILSGGVGLCCPVQLQWHHTGRLKLEHSLHSGCQALQVRVRRTVLLMVWFFCFFVFNLKACGRQCHRIVDSTKDGGSSLPVFKDHFPFRTVAAPVLNKWLKGRRGGSVG